MTDGFGHWLAGFIDGEGCFYIDPTRGRVYCGFALEVRSDDLPVLEEIRARVGFGKVVEFSRDGKGSSARWEVRTKADVALLVGLLTRYPLRAKKARDFAIWSEAVSEWGTAERGRLMDWTRLHELAQELRDGRRALAVA